MPFNTESDLIAGQRNGQWLLYTKGSLTAEGIGTWQSLWKANGQPAAGATPPAFGSGSGYVPTKDTAGAIGFGNPTSPAISALALMDFEFATAGRLQICDRLWACSGFSTVSTSAQNVVTPGSLPSGRDPFNGADVTPFIEVYTAPGATGATWTMTGVDAAGNTGRTWTYTHPANAETVGQMMQLLPGGASPATVLGCRQVTSFQCSVSSGTAGDVGVTLLRKIGKVTARAASDIGYRDYAQLGLRQVYDDSCLMGRVMCSTTSTGLIDGEILLAQN
jgi:hypothetical protein